MRRTLLGAVGLFAVMGAGLFAYNANAFADVLESALAGTSNVEASAHYGSLVDFSTAVLDIEAVGAVAPVDLGRVLIRFCQGLRSEGMDVGLVVAFHGSPRFAFSPDDVREIGVDGQNPLYVLRIIPVRADPLDGGARFTEMGGGLVGATQEIGQFSDFVKRWLAPSST